MTFPKGIAFDVRFVMAGNDAVGAWQRAGSWSADSGMDGFVPDAIAYAIAPEPVWERLAAAVQPGQVGLAVRENAGWRVLVPVNEDGAPEPPRALSNAERSKRYRQKQRDARRDDRHETRHGAVTKPVTESRDIVTPSRDERHEDRHGAVTDRHALGGGGASLSSLSGKRNNEDPEIPPLPPGDSVTGERDAGVTAPRAEPGFLLGAYTEGVREGLAKASGDPSRTISPFRPLSWRSVERMVDGHGPPGLDEEGVLRWVHETACAYVIATSAKAEFQAGFHPDKCINWLNAGRPRASSPGPARADVQPFDSSAPWVPRKKTQEAL